MISENFSPNNQEYLSDLIAFEEKQLPSYEDHLVCSSSYSLRAENDYDVELDDLDSEYDENDWEEEE